MTTKTVTATGSPPNVGSDPPITSSATTVAANIDVAGGDVIATGPGNSGGNSGTMGSTTAVDDGGGGGSPMTRTETALTAHPATAPPIASSPRTIGSGGSTLWTSGPPGVGLMSSSPLKI